MTRLELPTRQVRKTATRAAALTLASIAVAACWGGSSATPDATASFTPGPLATATPTEAPTATAKPLTLDAIIKIFNEGDPKTLADRADAWALNPKNWSLVYDVPTNTTGAHLAVDPKHIYHVVSTLNSDGFATIGQSYMEGNVPGKHKAIALVFAPGVSGPTLGMTQWPVAKGLTNEFATDKAWEQQIDNEETNQPNVCTMQITNSIHARPENVQDLSVAPEWQPLTDADLTAQQVADKYGVSKFAKDAGNWYFSKEDSGWVLRPNKTGEYSIIRLPDAIAQVSWNAKVEGSNQKIAGTLGVGTEAAVDGATVYAGVPKGMEKQVLAYALKQAAELERQTQPGVWVYEVSRSVCPTNLSESVVNPIEGWEQSLKTQFGDRVEPLSPFAMKIKPNADGSQTTVGLLPNEFADIWINGKWSRVYGKDVKEVTADYMVVYFN